MMMLRRVFACVTMKWLLPEQAKGNAPRNDDGTEAQGPPWARE